MGIVELLVLLAAVSGSAWIVGTVAWLWYRTKLLEERIVGQRNDPAQLAKELGDLRAELAASNDDVQYLHERLDFLERLLNTGDRESLPKLRGVGRREEAEE